MADVIDEVRPPAEMRRSDAVRRVSDEPVLVPVRRRPRRTLRYSLFGLGAALLVIGGFWYYLSTGRYVSTTDAYVQGNVLTVSTDVSGVVDRIDVAEGQRVAAGQVLFQLDPDKFRIALNNARANVDQIALTLRSLQADYQRAERQVAAQQAAVQADQDTYNRYAALVQRNDITRQQFDDARHKLAQDQATVGADEANVQSVLARLGGKADAPIEQMPAYQQAQSQLAEAQRQYDHSIVRAPFAGVVTQVNKLQPGQFLSAGTAAFGLVQSGDMWVAAEPKETTLTHVRPGQTATVTVDAYPGLTWQGTVQSVAVATDQEFSLLPAQNSSGNWVKVVQRVPVRVDIKPDPNQPPLSAGMSAEVSIDTHHQRKLADLF